MSQGQTMQELRQGQVEQMSRSAVVEAMRNAAGKIQIPDDRLMPVRVLRSVTVGNVEDSPPHLDFVIDIAVPVGVPLEPGVSLLITKDDLLTPIARTYYDNTEGYTVVTTQAVAYKEGSISLAGIEKLYIKNGWHVVSKEEIARADERLSGGA